MKTCIFEKFIIQDKISIDNSVLSWIETFDKEDNVNKSNRGGWQSRLLQQIPDRLSNEIENCINRNFQSKLTVVSYWVNINYPGSSNVEHIHPDSAISGCLYVTVPENSGNIVFVDKDYTIYDYSCGNLNTHSVKVTSGDIVFFKSNLPHYVEENKSDSNRISIAFNCKVDL